MIQARIGVQPHNSFLFLFFVSFGGLTSFLIIGSFVCFCNNLVCFERPPLKTQSRVHYLFCSVSLKFNLKKINKQHRWMYYTRGKWNWLLDEKYMWTCRNWKYGNSNLSSDSSDSVPGFLDEIISWHRLINPSEL